MFVRSIITQRTLRFALCEILTLNDWRLRRNCLYRFRSIQSWLCIGLWDILEPVDFHVDLGIRFLPVAGSSLTSCLVCVIYRGEFIASHRLLCVLICVYGFLKLRRDNTGRYIVF